MLPRQGVTEDMQYNNTESFSFPFLVNMRNLNVTMVWQVAAFTNAAMAFSRFVLLLHIPNMNQR